MRATSRSMSRSSSARVISRRYVKLSKGSVSVGPLVGRQPDLGRLGGQPQLLHGLAIAGQVEAIALELRAVPGLDVLEQPQHDRAVEVVAAQMRVAVGRQDLEDPVLHAQDRDVERAAAEVVDGDHALAEPLQAVGERGGGRLVDDADDVEAGDAAGVLAWPGAGCR